MWVVVLTALLIILLIKLRKRFNYFKDRGIPYVHWTFYPKTIFLFILGKKSVFEAFAEVYNDEKFKDEPIIGIFNFTEPTILLKSPELMKRITCTDFNKFSDRALEAPPNDPLRNTLVLTKNPAWKTFRAISTTFFTSSKLKAVYSLIDDLCVKVVKLIEKKMNGQDRIELNLGHVTNLYLYDVVGSVIVGVDFHSLDGENGEYQKSLKSFSELTISRSMELVTVLFIPYLSKFLNALFFGKTLTNFVLKILPRIFKEREKSKIKRNDFIDSIIEKRENKKYAALTDNDIYAQIGMLLVGGAKNVDIMLNLLLWELALNPKIQEKLRAEIKEKLTDVSKENEYDVITSSMPFLEDIYNEILRLYQLLPIIDRKCVCEDGYSLEPVSNFKIPHGMTVMIPISAISHDKNFYENPNDFNPGRSKNYKDSSFQSIPYGNGPRGCPAQCFSKIEIKAVIIKIFKSFRIEKNSKTLVKFKQNKKSAIVDCDGDLIVDFVRDPLYV